MAEHLVQDIQDKSSMHEFTQSFISPSSPLMQPRNGNRDAAGHNNRRSVFLESKLKEFEIEMERLSSRIEHLKSQNEVLNLTLSESKNHCDNITVLIGKILLVLHRKKLSYLSTAVTLFPKKYHTTLCLFYLTS